MTSNTSLRKLLGLESEPFNQPQAAERQEHHTNHKSLNAELVCLVEVGSQGKYKEMSLNESGVERRKHHLQTTRELDLCFRRKNKFVTFETRTTAPLNMQLGQAKVEQLNLPSDILTERSPLTEHGTETPKAVWMITKKNTPKNLSQPLCTIERGKPYIPKTNSCAAVLTSPVASSEALVHIDSLETAKQLKKRLDAWE